MVPGFGDPRSIPPPPADPLGASSLCCGTNPLQWLEFSYYRILMMGSFLFLFRACWSGTCRQGRTRSSWRQSPGILVNLPNWSWSSEAGRAKAGHRGSGAGTLGGSLFIVASFPWRTSGAPLTAHARPFPPGRRASISFAGSSAMAAGCGEIF